MTAAGRQGSARVEALAGPSAAWRRAVAAGPRDLARFHQCVAETDVLSSVEVQRPASPPAPPRDAVRVSFWNAERCKYGAESAALIHAQHADVTLLAEMDLGMARSGNRHTIRDVARATGQGYQFAVEFIELDLGDARERTWHASAVNDHGLHGGGIVSPHVLHDPLLVRLEMDGDWFDGRHGERRVGGRIAVAATLETNWGPLVLASVHFESHGDPAQRQTQMRVLCAALDGYAGDAPVVIGGDFNTNTIDRLREPTPEDKRALLAADPDRLSNPVPYEPMFEAAAEFGYDWQTCNAPGPTQRTRPDGSPLEPFVKLDWFFTRGVAAQNPRIVAATDEAGAAISDHELIRTDIRPSRSEVS